MNSVMGFLVGFLQAVMAVFGVAQIATTTSPLSPSQTRTPITFTASPSNGTAPLTVDFLATNLDQSQDYMVFFDQSTFSDVLHNGCLQQVGKQEGVATPYDCGALTSVPISHTYTHAGTYVASLVQNPGLGQTVVASTTVTVDGAGSLLPEILSFTAGANDAQPGQSVTLSWSTAHVQYCDIAAQEAWRYYYTYSLPSPVRVAASGSIEETPMKSTTYTLSCFGAQSAPESTAELGTFSPVRSTERVFVPSATTTPIGLAYTCYSGTPTAVLFGTTTLVGADPHTFVDFINGAYYCFGADKNHVFHDGAVMPGMDPNTFSMIGFSAKGQVYRNANALLSPSLTVVPDGDPNSFSDLTSQREAPTFAIDKNNVYCPGMQIIAGADPTTARSPDGLNLEVQVNGIQKTYDASCQVIAENAKQPTKKTTSASIDSGSLQQTITDPYACPPDTWAYTPPAWCGIIHISGTAPIGTNSVAVVIPNNFFKGSYDWKSILRGLQTYDSPTAMWQPSVPVVSGKWSTMFKVQNNTTAYNVLLFDADTHQLLSQATTTVTAASVPSITPPSQ